MKSMLDNYANLLNFFDEVLEESDDSGTRIKTMGIRAKMNEYNFLFGKWNLSKKIARFTHNRKTNLSVILFSSHEQGSKSEVWYLF